MRERGLLLGCAGSYNVGQVLAAKEKMVSGGVAFPLMKTRVWGVAARKPQRHRGSLAGKLNAALGMVAVVRRNGVGTTRSEILRPRLEEVHRIAPHIRSWDECSIPASWSRPSGKSSPRVRNGSFEPRQPK
jgi:hypothetical protein